MKNRYSVPKQLLLLLVIGVFLYSCVRPDLGDCGTTRLTVVFDPQMYELPANEHRIDRVNVYFFDENDLYVSSWQGGPYDYLSGQTYSVPVDLSPGKYRCIAWTNSGAPFQTTPAIQEFQPYVTSLREIQLYLDDSQGDRFEQDIPDLHYGMLQNAVVDASQTNDYTLYLIPDTYRIHVTVKGLPVSDDVYEFDIADNNTHISFDNFVVDGYNVCHYIRRCSFEQEKLQASMRVLSLTNDHAIGNIGRTVQSDRSPQFTFTNITTDTVLYSDDLVRMIRKAYQSSGKEVDFDKIYEYDIVLSFDAKLQVSISVNGWNYNPHETEL